MKQFIKVIKNFIFSNSQLKKNNVINLFIFFFGLLGYYTQYYLLTFYTIVHFFVLLAQFSNENFNTRLENFKKDQITIKNHYLEDFKPFYYLVFIVRLVTFLFYFYFFSLDVNNMNNFADLFYSITYIFILVGFIDLVIILYIIFYKNNPVIETFANFCYHCATKGAPLFGALHVSSNVPFIAPNPVSNGYHIYSPLGRGYGVWSSGQLIQIDYLKTYLGQNFNYHEIIDPNYMVNPQKLKNYTKSNGLSIVDSNLLKLATNQPKQS